MRVSRLATASLAALALSGSVLHAASPRDSLVVSVTWLAQHLTDSDLVLLHVGDKAEYDARHLPGARFVSLQDVSVSDSTRQGLALEMPRPDELRSRLAGLGISDSSRVVVYYGKDWVSPSTRIIFTLDYAGLGGQASLLDGGMDAWVRAGHEVTAEVPAARAGTLSPLKINPIVVDADYVKAHLGAPGVAVVDARAASFYDGVDTGGQRGGDAQRTGHIAGARSVPFTEVTDDRLLLRPAAELEALFTRAGVKPDEAVIGYCHVGQQATAMLFAARTLGHRVFLYDGSYQDWSRRTDYPVENPAKKNP